jgi:hypothetical protein
LKLFLAASERIADAGFSKINSEDSLLERIIVNIRNSAKEVSETRDEDGEGMYIVFIINAD